VVNVGKIFALLFALCLILLAMPPAVAASDTGRYVVVLRASTQDVSGIAAQHSAKYGEQIGFVYSHALKGYSATIPTDRLQEVENDPAVAFVEKDLAGDVTGKTVSQPAQTLPTGVDRVDGSSNVTLGRAAVNADVAVIDTGIDKSHPDLTVVGGINCGGQGSANDYSDGRGHGTGVAGIIGAKNNSIGTVGVAPGARLWAVRVANKSGYGITISTTICGIDWVTAHASTIEVANMSLAWDTSLAGYPGPNDHNCGLTNNDALHQAICRSVAAGVTYVVGAGNASADAAGSDPASYEEVMTISALADFDGKPGGLIGSATSPPYCRVDQDDTFADFSNYGAVIDMIAPGVCVNTTAPGGGYQVFSGTSGSAPHVTGAAALYKAAHPAATPAEVQAALEGLGSFDYDGSQDPDGIKEPLLDVSQL
jgi:subtilisin family serine protease